MARVKKRKDLARKEDLKRDAFDLYYNGRWTIAQLAARYGRSNRTIFRWIARGKQDPQIAAPVPKRTRHREKKYPDMVFDRIRALKMENSRRTASNIHYKLRAELQDKCPSIHLVRKFMAKEGLNVKDPSARKGYVKFTRKHANDLWQIDIAGVQHLPGLGDVYLFAMLDDCSRFCPAGTYFMNERGVNVIKTVRDGVEEHGRPNQLLSDNGRQFKNVLGDLGTRYAKLLETLDIEPIFSRCRHPQTKGKLEKFFSFVATSFIVEEYTWFQQHPNGTLDDLNAHFKEWLHWYNYERPHRSLPNKCTPASIFQDPSRRISRPLATIIDWNRWLVVTSARKVTKYNTIAYKKETIQLPPGYMGCKVDVVEGENAIDVLYKDKHVATHCINRDLGRLKEKPFLRKVNAAGFIKYKGSEYRVEPLLAGKQVMVKVIEDGKKLAIYIDNTLFAEYPIRTLKKSKI